MLQVDTGIPITGLLTIDETCHVLVVMADPRIAEEVGIQARSIAAGEDEKAQQQQQKDTVENLAFCISHPLFEEKVVEGGKGTGRK